MPQGGFDLARATRVDPATAPLVELTTSPRATSHAHTQPPRDDNSPIVGVRSENLLRDSPTKNYFLTGRPPKRKKDQKPPRSSTISNPDKLSQRQAHSLRNNSTLLSEARAAFLWLKPRVWRPCHLHRAPLASVKRRLNLRACRCLPASSGVRGSKLGFDKTLTQGGAPVNLKYKTKSLW